MRCLILALALLLGTGCASRSLVFTWTGPDGAAHQVRSRTTAILTRLQAADLREDLQTPEFIAGTRAGALAAAPDRETLEAIASAAARAAVQAALGAP
jgi:hypothetical protein